MANNNTFYIGIDVSKDTLDIYYNLKSYKIKNESIAISDFIKSEIAITNYSICFAVMESTGGYERLLATTLVAAGKAPPSPMPSKKRIANSQTNRVANPCNPQASDHHSMIIRKPRRVPTLSSRRPPIAYSAA